MRILHAVPTLAILAVLATACGRHRTEAQPLASVDSPVSTAPAVARTPAEEGKHIYKTKCEVCHGPDGAGDGPGAAALNPKPRSYQDSTWQSQTSDKDIRRAILNGGPAIGLSTAMPGYPALKSQPEVADALVQLIRSFGSSSSQR